MRLVNDEHRANHRQRFHETLGMAKQVGFHPALVDHLAVAGKRLVGGHQHRNPGIGRVNEALHRARRVVVHADFLAVVLLAKKLRRRLQAFERALPDRVRRHQHDELGQLFVLVQLMNRFDEGKRLARAGFHQHIQAQRGRGRAGDLHIASVDVVALPNGGNVAAQGRFRFGGHHDRVALRIGGRYKAHIVEHVGNALHRLGLVGEGGVLKLSCHQVSWRRARGPRK